jgi:hypothetical protein
LVILSTHIVSDVEAVALVFTQENGAPGSGAVSITAAPRSLLYLQA